MTAFSSSLVGSTAVLRPSALRPRWKPVIGRQSALRSSAPTTAACQYVQDSHYKHPMHSVVAVVAAAQVLLLPMAGPAAAALDTESSPAPAAGTAAKVEGSNLLDQSGSDALSALQDVAIPNAESALSKLDSSEAKSASLEINAAESAVSDLSEKAEKGLNDQAIKSEVSGIEQLLNAVKSTAGLD